VGPSGEAVRSVVVDTDLASDDLVALSFLLSSTEVDLVAVTVSGTGEVRCPQGLDVIRGLLAVTGDDDIPVACGRSAPLVGDRAFPTEWRDAADDAWGLDLPEVSDPSSERTAVELLTEALDPGGVTVLTLGPLTNLADAFRADADLAGDVSSVVVMGGAVDAPGNVFDEGVDPPLAEWNVYVDPTAAAEVLGSGAPVTMVGLDATSEVPITGDFLELLRINSHTESASLALTLLENNPLVYSGEAYFWDPLAAAVVVDPGLVTTETTPISVTTGDRPDSGQTARNAGGDPVTVALDADAAAFEQRLIRTLDQLEPDQTVVTMPPSVAEMAIRYDGTECTLAGPAATDQGRVRFTFESSEPGWFAGVAHLTGDRTIAQITASIEAGEQRRLEELGIDQPTIVGLAGGTSVISEPDQYMVLCGSEVGDVLIGGTFAVNP
jgi:inosine-uridine nucleoside N-ribohydrolase